MHQIIDQSVNLDSNKFYSYLDFQNNDFIRQKNVAGTLGLILGISTDDNLYVRGFSGINLQVNNGTTALALASTGAATFSSSVTAQLLAISNGYYLVGRNAANTAFRTLLTFDSSNKIIIGQDSDITAVTLGVGSEAMRITSGGNVLIGTTTDTGYMLRVTGYVNIGGNLVVNGDTTSAGFYESSDSRLKTLIQDNYQTKGIASITPKLYTKNGKVELGYYAQDFVGILDSAVSKGSDDMLSLSYREVLVAKVYALEQEIKELKAKMN